MLIKWLKKSALFGDIDARFRIAEIYRDGKYIEPSGEDALKWFNAILNDKNVPNAERYSAALEIAQIFHNGTIVPRSDTEAVKYFKLLASEVVKLCGLQLKFIVTENLVFTKTEKKHWKYFVILPHKILTL